MRAALFLLASLLPSAALAQELPLTLTSPNPEPGGWFGAGATGVPDTNGDGREDLFVGAPFEIGGGPFGVGRAYLFNGTTGALIYTLTSPNPEKDGRFGLRIAGVPDANGDGRGDLLVGAGLEDSGGLTNAGRVYLYSGATGALLRTLTSPNAEERGTFGSSVTGVPDVNGDGRGDLLVAADYEDGGALNAGRVYLYSGATGALLRTLTSPNAQSGGRFGAVTSGVPDADGDGRDDFLIGTFTENVGGRAYLFSGATGALLHTLTSPNPETNGYFGSSAAGVADTNGDGRGDLLIGAYQEDGGGTPRAGRAYLFSGATGELLHTLTSPNPQRDSYFSGTSGVEDVDGDGRTDLLCADNAYGEEGRVYLFSGAAGTLLRALASPDPEPFGHFGGAAGVEDVDGDGRGDLLASEIGDGLDSGRAHLLSSSSGVALSASGAPTTIPPGGTVTMTATVSNTTSQPAPLDLWVVVTRGNGNAVLTRVIGSGTLPAGATVTRSFGLTAPGSTPPGLYAVNVRTGDFERGEVSAADAFDVTVTAARVAGVPAVEPFVVETVPGNVFAGGEGALAAGAPMTVNPNPFSDRSMVVYDLPAASHVRLAVYDLRGREVALLVDGEQGTGRHEAVVEAENLPSGVYLVRLNAGNLVQTQRMTLVR